MPHVSRVGSSPGFCLLQYLSNEVPDLSISTVVHGFYPSSVYKVEQLDLLTTFNLVKLLDLRWMPDSVGGDCTTPPLPA